MASVKHWRDNYKGAGQWRHLAQWMNRIGAALNDIHGENGITVRWSAGRLHLAGTGSADFDFSQAVFGYTAAGAVVTILNGEVRHGAAEPIEVPATAVAISVDYSYVGVEFDGATVTIPAASPDKALFRSDAQTYRTWLYQFRLIAGVAVRHRVGHQGPIDLAGWFGG